MFQESVRCTAIKFLTGHCDQLNYDLNKSVTTPKMCPHSLMEEEKMNHINGQCPKWSFQRRGLKFWFWFREQTCHIGPGSRSEYTERPREITTKQVSPTNEERTQGLTFRFHLLKLNRGNHRTSSFSGHLDRSPFR